MLDNPVIPVMLDNPVRFIPVRLDCDACKVSFRLALPKDGGPIEKAVKSSNVWEPETTDFIMRALRPRDMFVDLGANIGWFTVLAAKIVGKHGCVYAFEPGDSARALLEKNLAANFIDNVTIDPRVVSDHSGSVQFFQCSEDWRSSLWDPAWDEIRNPRPTVNELREVNATTLDSVPALFEGPIRMMKLDIEGAELLAIKGAKKLLASTSAPRFIICELNPFAMDSLNSTQEELRETLHSFGYETFLLPGGLPYLVPLRTDIRLPKYIVNLLFTRIEWLEEIYPFIDVNVAEG